MILRALLLLSLAPLLVWADLKLAMAEPNLEKRAEKAILNVQPALDRARNAYREGSAADDKLALEEARESIDLAKQSLKDSGKDARRNSKYFKKVEQELRKILRRLESMKVDRGVDDREPVDKLLELSRQYHDELIMGIMGKKK